MAYPRLRRCGTLSGMNKSLLLGAAVACLFMMPIRAADDNAALKEELVGLEKKSWEAWKARDGKFFQDFLSEDHVELGAYGVSHKAEIVKFVGSPACTVKSYDVSDFACTLLNKETALLTYRAAQDTFCTKQVPSPCWVSSLYVKRDGRWQNAVYQQTVITQ